MGKASRDKGKRGERKAVSYIRRVWPSARRGAAQSRAGSDAADVEGTPLWWEVKHGKRPGVRAALRQALADTDGRDVAVVIFDDRCEPFVVLPWSTYEAHADAYAREWGE